MGAAGTCTGWQRSHGDWTADRYLYASGAGPWPKLPPLLENLETLRLGSNLIETSMARFVQPCSRFIPTPSHLGTQPRLYVHKFCTSCALSSGERLLQMSKRSKMRSRVLQKAINQVKQRNGYIATSNCILARPRRNTNSSLPSPSRTPDCPQSCSACTGPARPHRSCPAAAPCR